MVDKKDKLGKSAGALYDRYMETAGSPHAQSAIEVRLDVKIAEAQAEIKRLHGTGHELAADDDKGLEKLLEKITLVGRSIDSMEALKSREEGPRLHTAHKAFATSIKTMTGGRETTRAVAAVHRSPSYAGSALTMAEGMSSRAIEAHAIKAKEERAQAAGDLQAISANLQPGDDRTAYDAAARRHDRAIISQGVAEKAIAKQKKMGTDIESRYDASVDFVGKIVKKQAKEDAREEVRTGAAGSREDIASALSESIKEAIRAQKEFSEALRSDAKNKTDTATGYADAHERAQAAVEKFSTQLDETSKIGDQRQRKIEDAGRFMQSAGAVANGAGDMYRQWAVSREQGVMQTHTGTLNIGNRMWDDTRAAGRGDMAALLRLQNNSYGKAVEFGKEQMGDAETAAWLNLGGTATTGLGKGVIGAGGVKGKAAGGGGGIPWGGIAMGALTAASLIPHPAVKLPAMAGRAALAARVASAATKVASKIPKPVLTAGKKIGARGALVGAGALSALPEIVSSSGQLADLSADIGPTGTLLSNAETFLAKEGAQQYISAQTMQVAMDHTRSSYRATAGAGKARSSMLHTMRDTSYMEQAAQYGLDLNDINDFTAKGVGALGGQYRTGDILKAGEAMKAGQVSSTDQYLGLRQDIAGAGGGSGDLEKVLANAVKLGMDSSKQVGDMVRTITSVAAASSRGGISTFGGAEEQVMKAMKAAEGAGISEAMRPQVVGDVSQQFSNVLNEGRLTVPRMMQVGSLSQKLHISPGGLAMGGAMKLKPEQISQVIQDLDIAEKSGLHITDPKAREKYQTEATQAVKDKHGLYLLDQEMGGKLGKKGMLDIGKASAKMVIQDRTDAYMWTPELSKTFMDAAESVGTNTPEAIALRKDADKKFRAATLAKTGTAESLEPILAFADFNKAPDDTRPPVKPSGGPVDSGLAAQIAAVTTAITEYAGGLKAIMSKGGFGAVTDQMKAAGQTDPSNFATMVNGAGTNLKQSVDALSVTVDKLNLKLGGTNVPLKKEDPAAEVKKANTGHKDVNDTRLNTP